MWLNRAFSMLEQEDVEVDLEQLDTLAKVGTRVQQSVLEDMGWEVGFLLLRQAVVQA